MRAFVFLTYLLVSVASCRDDKPREDVVQPASGSSIAPSATSKAAPAETVSATVMAIREAAKCAWIEEKSNPAASVLDPECSALKNWITNFEGLESTPETDLLSLLADSDRAVRWIAARALISATPVRTKYRKDAAASSRLIKLALQEKDPAVGRALGTLAGRISLESAQVSPALLDLLQNGSDPVRESMVSDLIMWNGSMPEVNEAAQNVARKPGSAELRSEVIRAIAARGGEDALCKFLVEMMHDAAPLVAGQAAYQAAGAFGTAGCPRDFGIVLSEVENRLSKPDSWHQAMAGAAGRIPAQSTATAEQKKRALAILRKIVETKTLDDMSRSRALDALAASDPNVRAFATKFKQDDSIQVKTSAEKALEKK